MTIEQFYALKIGDKVMNSYGTNSVAVSDIDRINHRLQTSGSWRYYKTVRLPPVEMSLTPVEPCPDEITLSINMLRCYGLTATGIIMAVRRAGPEGFVGSIETLCYNTHVCTSVSACRHILHDLVKGHVLIRKDISKSIFQLTESHEGRTPLYKKQI